VREDISEVKTVVTNEDIPNPNVEKTPAVTIADIPLKEKDIEEGE
jgi:hypothetical protein